MSKEYPCVYYDHKKCQKFSDDKFTSWCVLGHCPDETPSNGDRIRAMSDEELVKIVQKMGCPSGRNYITCGTAGTCETCWLEWLRGPAERPPERKDTAAEVDA